jgi:hypothetical protein
MVLVISNIVSNMILTYQYDLKMGLLNKNMFKLFAKLVEKPWNHLQNVGFGCIAGYYYW